jgi:hypothetical protein
MTHDLEIVLKYRRCLRLVKDGATEGERKAAAHTVAKMESKYPGIHDDLMSAEKTAKTEAKKVAVQKAGFSVPNLDDLPDTWVARLLGGMAKKAVDWSIDRITREFDLDLEPHLKKERKMRKKKDSIQDLIQEWSTQHLIDAAVDEDWLEDNEEAEVEFHFTVPQKIWAEFVASPKLLVEALSEILESTLNEEAGFDEDGDDSDDDDAA